jgi:hypothetical protein
MPASKSVDFDSPQYSIFKDCLTTRVLSLPGYHDSSNSDTNDDQGSDLDDFTSYLASELWPFLPPKVRDITHTSSNIPTREDVPDLVEELDIPASFSDTLTSYGLVSGSSSSSSTSPTDARTFLLPILTSYLADATAEPQRPNWSATRSKVDGCELCGRDVPLTYHHLVPKSVHDKAVKRGWHEERMLNKVAWLCR